MDGSDSEQDEINVMVSKFISNKNLKIDIKKYKNVDYENSNSHVSASTNCQSPVYMNSSSSKSPVRKFPSNESSSQFDSPKSP
jgi:hypothetical protein